MACACSSMASVETSKVEMATVDEVTKISQMDNVGFKIWRAPTYDDRGVEAAATWQKAMAVTVATINTLAAWSIARRQLEIAEGYKNLFREHMNRYFGVYAPLEQQYMISVGIVPKYVEKYAERASSYSRYARDNFFGAVEAMTESLKGLVCVDKSIMDRLNMDFNSVSLEATDAAYRTEDYNAIKYEDIRRQDIADALNRGRSLLNQSVDFAQTSSSMYGKQMGVISTAAEGAASALGYFSSRDMTSYPTGGTGYAATDLSYSSLPGDSGRMQAVSGLTNPIGNMKTV